MEAALVEAKVRVRVRVGVRVRVRVRVRVKGEGQVDLEAVGRGALAHARLDRGQQRARAALLLGEDHGEVVAQRRGQQLLETAPRHLVRVRLRVRVRARARARVGGQRSAQLMLVKAHFIFNVPPDAKEQACAELTTSGTHKLQIVAVHRGLCR